MNDELREKLSAYLDGALSDMDRKDVEERLARDEETRLELEALRAVSGAVKGLGREPLPGGFFARLQARRARETTSKREWVFLPPAYRPVAAALSMAIVAFAVWDKAHGPDELAQTVWNSVDDRVAVKTASELPSSLDVSGRLSAMGAAGAVSSGLEEQTKKEDSPKVAPAGKRVAAPGKPIEVFEDAGAASEPAPAPPASAAPASSFDRAAAATGQSFQARNEEERSAMNERLYQNFEEEKKRMGIAQIIEKDSKSDDRPARERSDVMALNAAPEAFSLNRAGSVGAVRGVAKSGALSKAKSAAPAAAVKAIALKSAEALQAAWAAAGLSGEPPAVDFPKQMALFLAGPRGCGITSVENRKKFIVVLYKDSGLDDASRVRAVASSSKPVVVKLAE